MGQRRILRSFKIFWRENENTEDQNLWDVTKALLRGRRTALNGIVEKLQEALINQEK